MSFEILQDFDTDALLDDPVEVVDLVLVKLVHENREGAVGNRRGC